MSEPTPRGPTPPDALEALLRAAAADMDYPPTPPLAGAVRARLEREAAAPPRRRWWRGDALTPRPLSQGERGVRPPLSQGERGVWPPLSPGERGVRPPLSLGERWGRPPLSLEERGVWRHLPPGEGEG